MTDRQKIISLLELFLCDVEEYPESFRAGGRRYFTDENGDIIKITTKDENGNRITAVAEEIAG